MSVLTVGGQRLAAGLDWQRERVRGRAAGRIAKQRMRPWIVDVGEQTGFLNAAEKPEGSRPLAAVLIARRSAAGSWAAFIEEDAPGGRPGRVAVLRGSGDRILPGGDTVFASGEAAFKARGNLQGDRTHLVVTPGLVEFAPDAEVVPSERIAEGAAKAPEMIQAPAAGMSTVKVMLLLVLLLAAVGAIVAWQWGDEILRMAGWGPKEAEEEPLVAAVVRTVDFLQHCQAAVEGHRVSMSGFDRQGIACHPRFAQGVSGISPGGLAGRPVLEVHWGLREGLDPRVYVPLAQDMLDDWPIATIDDKGASAAFGVLPVVLALYDGEAAQWSEPTEFRRRLDMALGLRGFEMEYGQWGAEVEFELITGRPLREAVAMLMAIEGLEVVSAVWSREKGWAFSGRRTQPLQLRESEFQALTGSPAAAATQGAQGRAG